MNSSAVNNQYNSNYSLGGRLQFKSRAKAKQEGSIADEIKSNKPTQPSKYIYMCMYLCVERENRRRRKKTEKKGENTKERN